MSILMDSSNLIAIQIFYIEEKKKQGGSIFRFMKNQEEFDEWKRKGYVTQEEFDKAQQKGNIDPGMPESPSLDPEKIIQSLSTWWSKMSWKEQNSTYSRCLKQVTGPDGDQITILDTLAFRDLKLKTCLKKWSLTDNEGQEVPVSEMVVDMLVPEVAQELLTSFERVTEISEEDLGN